MLQAQVGFPAVVYRPVLYTVIYLAYCSVIPNSSDSMNCSPPGSSVYGIFQARLEWVAISYSRGSSWSRDQTHISSVSCIDIWFFTTVPPRGPLSKSLCKCHHFKAFLVAQILKNLPVMQETRIQSLGQEDPLERGIRGFHFFWSICLYLHFFSP